MLWYTHAIAGAAAGALVFKGSDNLAITAGICAVSALLPDIDLPASKIGGNHKAVSKTINLIFGHRTITHSVLGLGLFMMLFNLFIPQKYLPMIAVGYISHLLTDMLNPSGISLLWPLSKRFRIPIVRTGGILEHVLLVCFCLVLFKNVII